MTDKQIKEGIDVSQCECYSVEGNSCNKTLSGSCMKEKCQTFRLLQTIKAKEQECEELTSQRDKFEFGNNILEHERNNYKQALDGIEKQVKAMNNECFYDDICDCNNCDMKNGCSYYRKFKILDIINSVKDKNVPHKAKDSE